MPLVESEDFWREMFVTVKKEMNFMGNIHNHQERKGFNVKLPKPSRTEVS